MNFAYEAATINYDTFRQFIEFKDTSNKLDKIFVIKDEKEVTQEEFINRSK